MREPEILSPDTPAEELGFISSLCRQTSLPWNVVSTLAMAGFSISVAILMYLLAMVEVADSGSYLILFMVHNVDLVFHEAGHWIFGVFGNRTLTILGGSLNQVLIPLIVAFAFWRQRDATGFAFGMFWMFESLRDVSVYMADARALELPLLGGGGEEVHDWRNLFIHWRVLNKDVIIAGYVRKVAWAGMVSTSLWLVWRWFKGKPDA